MSADINPISNFGFKYIFGRGEGANSMWHQLIFSNMTQNELQDIIRHSEVSTVQFKERIDDNYKIGTELVAFSNSKGGRLFIGIKDKTGEMNPLSYRETQDTCERLGDIATQNVDPHIGIEIDTVAVEGGNIVVVTIAEGINKPYKDNKGIIWAKQGSDKRRIIDNSEIAYMMAECGSFFPDEAAVADATIEDLDEGTLKLFFLDRFATPLEKKGISADNIRSKSIDTIVKAIAVNFSLRRLLANLHLIRPNGKLTVAAMLLFGIYPQRFLPAFTTKCVSFVGNTLGSKIFRDRVKDSDMEGNLLHQYNTIMNFFTRNLRIVQCGEEFNQQGEYEISLVALSELTVNALIHRSLTWEAPIRIFIFDDRVEIHSPGTLPRGLMVDDIERGTSIPRNRLLFNNAICLLPYSGIGTGIPRAIGEDTDIRFYNDENLHEFVIIIPRDVTFKSNEVDNGSNEVGVKSNEVDKGSNEVGVKSNEVDKGSNQVRTKVTKKQQDIINFCSVPRTTKEILDRVGVSNQSANRIRYINSLVDAGLLKPLFPESPTAPNQKYVRK